MKIHKQEVPVPENMKSLPMADNGYLKPWFVLADDFRVVDPNKALEALSVGLCWICGKKTHANVSFVTGWRSARSCVSNEPPCHPGCADYAMRVCPFILLPRAIRREAGLTPGQLESVGNFVAEHPQVYYVTTVRDYTAGTDVNGILYVTWKPRHIRSKVPWYKGETITQARADEIIREAFPEEVAYDCKQS